MFKRAVEVTSVSDAGPFGGDLEMRFYGIPTTTVPIEPLVRHFFDNRNQVYWESPHSVEKQSDSIVYKMTMVQLAETFFANYTPDQIRRFLKPRMERNANASLFFDLLMDFEKKFKLAIPVLTANSGRNPHYSNFCFFPLNLPTEEMNHLLRLNVDNACWRDDASKLHGAYHGYRDDVSFDDGSRLSRVSRFYYGKSSLPEIRVRSLSTLRQRLLEKPPQVVLPVSQHDDYERLPRRFYCGLEPLHELTDFEILSAYNFPTGHLRIARRKSKK